MTIRDNKKKIMIYKNDRDYEFVSIFRVTLNAI